MLNEAMGSNDAQRASLCISLLSACLFPRFCIKIFSTNQLGANRETHSADIRIPRSSHGHGSSSASSVTGVSSVSSVELAVPTSTAVLSSQFTRNLGGFARCLTRWTRVLSDDLCALCCLTETWWSKCSTSIWSWIVKVCAARITLFLCRGL